MITKFYNKTININDCRVINPDEFRHTHKLKRSLLYLSLHHLIQLNDNDSWIITPRGIQCLYDIVKKYPSQASS